jgi:hypothetical protein
MTNIELRGTEQLDALAGRLAGAPRRLRDQLRSRMSAAARPAAQDVRREIRSVSMAQTKRWTAKSPRPAGARLGRGSSPLRTRVAQAVEVHASVLGDGARVEIELKESQVAAQARWLVPFVTGRKKRLRHPFMGRWRHAVQATGDLNVWWPTIRKHVRDFARARDRAVADVERYLGS